MKSAKRIAKLLREAAEELEKAEGDFYDLIPNPDWLLYDKEGRLVGVAAWAYADYEDTGEITSDTYEQVRMNHEYIWVYLEDHFPLYFELEEGFLEWAEELGLRVEEQ